MRKIFVLTILIIGKIFSQDYGMPRFEGMNNGVIKWYFDETTLSGVNIMNYGSSSKKEAVELMIQNAFNIWDQSISSSLYSDNIKFVKGTANDHMVNIYFTYMNNVNYRGNTDGIYVEGTFAGVSIGLNSHPGFDWQGNNATQGEYLQSTLVHEIGHAVLGTFGGNVGHASNGTSVMRSDFSSTQLILTLPSYDAVNVYSIYNHCEIKFESDDPNGYTYITDPRTIGSSILPEVVAPDQNGPVPGAYQILAHGQSTKRSYQDKSLLIGPIVSSIGTQGLEYRTVTKWLFGPTTINSNQLQFTSISNFDIYRATFDIAFQFAFQSGQFLDGPGPTNYFDYMVGSDIIKYKNTNRYYKQDQYVYNILSTPPTGYYFYKWADGNSINPRNILSVANISLGAIYKAQLKSNNVQNLTANGTHKFLRTGDGVYHLIYNSAGKVWYESSTDEGTTWSLRYSDDGDLPAIAAVNNSRVVIVYPSNTQYIKAVCLDNSSATPMSTASTLGREIDIPSDLTIAINSNGKIAIAYYNSMDDGGDALPGYYGLAGSISSSGVITWGTNSNYRTGALASSTAKNGVMEVRSESPEILFHFAFDDVDANEDRQIYYGPLKWSSTTLTRYVYSPYNNCLSGSSGFQNNTNPSLIPWSGEGFRINWIGNIGSPYAASVFRDPSNPTYWTFGSNVLSTSMNKASDGYVIGWSNGTLHNYANNSNLYSLGTISSNGQYLQIGNSNTRATMRAIGFNTSVSPYQFNLSTPIGAPLQKGSSVDENEILGRGIVISLNHKEEIPEDIDSTSLNHSYQKNAQYSYLVNNIVVDENTLTFIDLPVGEQLMTPETINNHLVTNPFVLKNSSAFSFDIVSEVVNSNTEAGSVLNEKGFVKFTVELIDVVTGQIYEVQSKVVKTNSSRSGVMVTSYTVDCEGVGEKEFQLRIKFTTTELAEYALIEKISNASDNLQKSGSEKLKISFTKKAIVSDYSLSQNYPNPFNPVTVISYALPKAGHVSISVYDALGREVAQLIHGEQNAGRHTVNFDASKLSSGIYLYKMTSGTFSETRKMILMK